MDITENILEKIQFTSENGLVFCNRIKDTRHISEHYHIEEKAKKLGATAVLFRRKYDEQNTVIDSKPVLYIYKGEDVPFNSPSHRDLHAKIWSAGDIEVYFIISETRIDIINARKPAEVKENESDDNKLDVTNLRLISETLQQFNDQRFSAMVFGRGAFWEQEDFFDDEKETFYKNRLKTENTPFSQLLDYLIAIREDLHNKRKELSTEAENLHDKQKNLSAETIDKLLIVCILIKFLEEIRDDEGTHTLRDIYKKHNINDFAEALDKRFYVDILKQLGGKFKGNIFDIFSDEEEEYIADAELSLIAKFLRAKFDPRKNQYFLWEQYSFNYLPVELISAIYENFLPKEKGVVYTPPFLVNFLIDEVMPLNKARDYFSENQFKVLDPSCGSGVFLVAVYKRMLQWWSINEYYAKGESGFSKPDKAICQEILQKNILGVDISETATLITVFSLTIALLGKLEPKEIWTNLELNNLQENIQTRNFFEWATEHKKDNKRFDLVIGNPPFNRSTTKKESVSENRIQEFGLSSVPGNDLALKFFEWSMFFGQHTCLILPSNVLLYRRDEPAEKYRTCIFTEFTVKKIFDFTHLRRHVLFGSAEVSACAILASPEKNQGQNIEHIVIKRLASVEKKLFFEIDHYDCHIVPHRWAVDPDKQFVWKTNLLGGGRLFHLIYRLSLLPTLKNFIDSQTNWKEIRGFEGGTELVAENQEQIIGITKNSLPEIKRDVNIYSNDLKPTFMYEPPFMIIDQILDMPACFIPRNNNFTRKEYLFYNRDFIGISVPQKDENILSNIFDVFLLKHNSNLLNYKLYVLSVSSSALVLTETDINKSEILSVPFLENKDYLTLSKSELILQNDVLEYYVHLGKAISKKGEGRKLEEKVNLIQLEKFGQIFCDTLNPIYVKNGKSWQCGRSYQTQLFTIYQFGYGKNEGLSFQVVDELDDIIKPLIYNTTSHRSVIFTRVCRIYKHINGYDCIFLIKPSTIRYWLGSIALRDADETFMDLRKAGR